MSKARKRTAVEQATRETIGRTKAVRDYITYGDDPLPKPKRGPRTKHKRYERHPPSKPRKAPA